MKILKTYFDFINESLPFSMARNSDLPATLMNHTSIQATKTLILDVEDEEKYPYKIKDRRHGTESHAIKHLHELDKPYFNDLMRITINYIKNKSIDYNMAIINSKGLIEEEGEIIDGINTFNVLNLLDFINDKKFSNQPLDNDEKYLYDNVIVPMSDKYDQIISNTLHKAVDLNDNVIKSKGVVKFDGALKDNTSKFYYDIQNKIIIIQRKETGEILTANKLNGTIKNKLDKNLFFFEPKAEQIFKRHGDL